MQWNKFAHDTKVLNPDADEGSLQDKCQFCLILAGITVLVLYIYVIF